MSDSEDEVEYEPEEFVIDGRTFSITTIAYLPIAQLMNNRSKDVEISGQKLWCGSLGIIQHLLNNPDIVGNTAVVELGAGTGVLGMICKTLGALKVTLTDHDERSLLHMKNDLISNNIEASVIPVNWFDPVFDSEALFPVSEGPRVLRVVAGDVLYKNALLVPFFNTVSLLFGLCEDCQLLLCHVPRAGVEQADVTSHAAGLGFSVEEVPVESWSKGEVFRYCPEEDLVRARIYCIRRLA